MFVVENEKRGKNMDKETIIEEKTNSEYYNVPVYIEKLIKKATKTHENLQEMKAQLKDYMESHDIPIDTPVSKLKHFEEPDVHPDQMKMNEKGEIE